MNTDLCCLQKNLTDYHVLLTKVLCAFYIQLITLFYTLTSESVLTVNLIAEYLHVCIFFV